MQTSKVERVRGVRDVLPNEYDETKQIEEQLKQCFESFGYRPVDVPLIEHTELYLRKSGEDIIARLYDFAYRNRRLCLRPEMTASVTRAYIDNFQGTELLPVRLYYSGAVFRYERPQRARYRQFTQMGIEIIGAAGATSDAEVIACAYQGLNQLQLQQQRLIIGHIGVLSRFLESLELESRLCNFLLGNTEILRQKEESGKRIVEERLAQIYPAFQAQTQNKDSSLDENPYLSERLVKLFQGMESQEATNAILDLLESLNIQLKGNRDPQEIAERLLMKIKRPDQTPRVKKALEFMSELAQLRGNSAEVFQEGEKLLDAYGIERTPLDELRATMQTLESYDLDDSKIQLDLGLSRGLQYYTGMIFEIHHGSLGAERQLCGGGRYDDLVANLGGRKGTPATGFSYGLERIRFALESEQKNLSSPQWVDVLVVASNLEVYGYVIQVAQQLRNQGIRVELDVRNKGVSSNFQYADKKGIPFVIVAGEPERINSEVVLKNMISGEQKKISVHEVVTQIKTN